VEQEAPEYTGASIARAGSIGVGLAEGVRGIGGEEQVGDDGERAASGEETAGVAHPPI
jgi:hypothetical protein